MENEKRLIDAYSLMKKVDESKQDNPHTDNRLYINHHNEHNHFLRMIFCEQPVDAVEVVHGHWVYYSTTMQECSNCKRHTARHKFNYCPHCGAVMEDRYYE